jgi:DsbC/DsbD-like thiol-disulfide interchange protein
MVFLMQLLIRLVFISLASIALPQIALADYSPAAQSAGGTMRIATLPVDANGVVSGMLDINLLPGWITYWREPGASGIPPQITVFGEAAASVSKVAYPVPKKITVGDFLDIGYDAPVRIPFELTVQEGVRAQPIELSVLIGVCNNICIPFMQSFTIDPASSANAEQIRAEIAQARKTLPSSTSETFKVDSFAIGDNQTSVDLTLTVPEGTKTVDEVIIAGPSGHAYTLINKQSVEGNKAVLNVDAISLPANYQSAGKLWHVLLRAGEHVIETPLQFPN